MSGNYTVPTKTGTASNTSGPNSVKQHVASYLNAFNKHQHAKIGDGSVTSSLPEPRRSTATADTGTNDGVLHIVMYPGIEAGVVWRNTADVTAGNKPNIMDYPGSYALGPNNFSAVALAAGEKAAPVTTNILKWRIVSQGLRATLLNPDETNDGWFEAIRSNSYTSAGNFALDGSSQDGEIRVVPSQVLFAGLTTLSNLAEEPSYVTGALKNLHDIQFDQSQNSQSHDYNNIRGQYNVVHDTGTLYPDDINRAEWPLSAGEDDNHELLNRHIDLNRDFLYLRIYGGVAGSKILLELATNFELVYSPATPLHKYQTDGANHKKAQDAADSIKSTIQSAGVRRPAQDEAVPSGKVITTKKRMKYTCEFPSILV